MRGEIVKGWVPGVGCCVLVLVLMPGAASAQVAMPNPAQMSGVPLPSPELPAGTITVRVVRGTVSNNVPNHKVTLTSGAVSRDVSTDASGRAQFSGLAPGAAVKATTTVDGAVIESQVITMPPQAGVRVMLVAPDGATAGREAENARLRTAPAQPGIVVLGGESRFIVERGDESLNVFYVLEIVNTARTPVATEAPVIFDLPSGATGATLLEGSTPQATVSGTRVTVTGPFAPGKTPLQIAYELPYRGSRVTIEQRLPAALPQLAAAGETTGGVKMTSPLIVSSRDMDSDGRAFLVGNGAAIPAGGTLTLTFENLPHHARWPRFTALGIAVAIMVAGLVIGFGRRTPPATAGRKALVEARTARFAELEALEERRRTGAASAAEYAAERRRIVGDLEDIYTALDAPQHG